AGPGAQGRPALRPALVQLDRSRQAHNEVVIDMAELRRMSQAERQELARLLAELGVPVPLAGSAAPQKPATPRQDIAPGPPGPVRADPYQFDPVLRRARRLARADSTRRCPI